MSQTAPHDGFNTGSDERLKLVRENNKLRKEVELFQKSEDSLTSQVRSLESKVDQLEEEKYKLLEEVSSIKCDLNIKDTENKRSKTKLDQIRSQCLALEERYLKQKEKLQKVMSSEKEFYKALQEVLDYYYESLLKYSQFSTKMLYKLMVNESINIQQELKEEFNTKMTGLKILKENIEIPSVKVNKNSLFRNLKQRVAFFQDINFDKTQLAFDKLLSELKNQGVKLEVGDMTLFVDGITASKIAKRGSIYDDTSVLNESYGTDPNMSQTMFLADLDKMDNTMNMSGTAKGGSFTSLSDHLNALKTQLSGKPEEGPDYQNMNKILQDMTNFVDFLHGNIDNGTKVTSG